MTVTFRLERLDGRRPSADIRDHGTRVGSWRSNPLGEQDAPGGPAFAVNGDELSILVVEDVA